MQRDKTISDCIQAMYIRFRKRLPEPDILKAEIRFAVKDLWEIEDKDLKEAFSHAYRRHDKTFPPLTKEILAYWKARGEAQSVTVKGCGACAGGLISAARKEEGIHFKTGEKQIVEKAYTFRCDCAAGNSMSKTILVWNNQTGYKKK